MQFLKYFPIDQKFHRFKLSSLLQVVSCSISVESKLLGESFFLDFVLQFSYVERVERVCVQVETNFRSCSVQTIDSLLDLLPRVKISIFKIDHDQHKSILEITKIDRLILKYLRAQNDEKYYLESKF